jgi:NTP pyrophosphatase (non-canonical NTP hydrolase)
MTEPQPLTQADREIAAEAVLAAIRPNALDRDILDRIPATVEALLYVNPKREPTAREDAYNKGVRDLAAAIAGLRNRLAPDPRPAALTFAAFAKTNLDRCEAADGFNHDLMSWSLSDWFTAAMGEFGEAANKAKKLNRERDGVKGNTETLDALRAGLADEIADTVIYLDLLAQHEGFDLGQIVASKFNRTSEKIGAPHRLEAPHD